MTSDRSAHLAAAAWLLWYGHMGVDAALADEGVDWRERGDTAPGAGMLQGSGQGRAAEPAVAPRPAARKPQPGSGAGAPPARPSLAPKASRPALNTPAAPPAAQFVAASPHQSQALPPSAQLNLADTAPTLAALKAVLLRFDACPLKATATNTCVYRGAEKARIMLIGDAPGRDEDLAGKPFVGRAGQLLDRMLAAVGFNEADVHIANVVYWRPPGNRTPTPLEAEACRPFLEHQIGLVDPQILILLGGAPAKHVLGLQDGIMRTRGRMRSITINGRDMAAMATLHPDYLLRTPIAKRLAWSDLLAVRAHYDAARPNT